VKGCTVIEHPLAQQALAEMRHRDTSVENFRRALGQLGLLLLAEATRDLPLKTKHVRTPLAMAPTSAPARPIALVPILRAGQGMVSLADHLLPQAIHAHLGMSRNEDTLQPECYLEKLPPRLSRFDVLVCDPMLATAGSAIAAGQLLAQRGARHLRFVHALAAPEGIRALRKAFPQSPIFTAAIDERLNEQGYIVPGLGDAGDRCFGC